MHYFFAVKGLIATLIMVAVVIVLFNWPKTKGRTWLLLFAILTLCSTFGFVISGFLMRNSFFGYYIFNAFNILLNIISLAATVCVLLYVIIGKDEVVTDEKSLLRGYPAQSASQTSAVYGGSTSNSNASHPLYGVKGWLNFFVVIAIYVSPILFALGQLVTWVSYVMIAERYPLIIVVGLIDTAVWIYLVYRGIQVGKGLRDIKPRAVQNTKTFFVICLVWNLLSIPLSFLSGLNPENLIVDAVKTLFGSVVGFAIWYSYFNVSQRVKATYPDWNE
jgi:hypothetical protein